MLDPRSDAALKALMMTGYHLNPDYFDGSLWNDPDLFDEERSRQQQKRSRFKAFLRIMSSWVPPAVALAFVVSFELGRRERLKAEKLLLEKAQGDDDNSDMSLTRALAADEEVRSRGVVGAIKVSDIVLGYGGHGTVVYKGSLDGRSIAVKRMLKTYHASANREISLLIESDGHPNVVRYFLKEVRGDFVYLALELCDMSLHELIAAIGEHKYWRKEKSVGKKRHGRDLGGGNDVEIEDGISHSTRDTLLQIASGVRHLHSLRIVHRDLKVGIALLCAKFA
jgi:serine/threonine-protein kinase/endoribonuclease IRE1